jgi:hypothetical protein
MEYIQAGQTLLGDAFITLPLLLIGFSFFFGTLTSNIGMLYLFLGHLLIVPMSSFVLNEEGRPWMANGQFNIVKAIKYVISIVTLSSLTYGTGTSDDGFTLAKFILSPFTFLLHLYLLNFHPNEITPVPQCAVIPGLKDTDKIYTNPSSWLNHITFFMSYIFANANSIFNLPSPSITSSGDPNQDANRQAKLDLRVRNRKWLTTTIMVAVVVIFALLIAFRFTRTPCEAGFLRSILPIFLTSTFGFSWFNFVYEVCGVRPADVLGIVQGLISPELIDNPIVCVGS